ncbi:hypothetical protein BX616_000068 [Lobosporangium transversale]|uniref:Uncharacterized protein n=1 Tax=Lobosporangium transversale TaxID=64571 RepID=A0A1Y2G7W9_9FUNG|nr:hypothetical protein BCR41DRAFT_375250 [Lobosporangium transversale]KAF9908655.1 hypothetical protein BX616_000068 [Lobosporangium transversale]ORZ01862.1 hypothetical protein BCR41DRAFT_375250 [Lobosporangium transversale]|eukprot:XP_021876159.1 hypothetical protein BCR41DRAFT_375250 [Lobosporangium transversale]
MTTNPPKDTDGIIPWTSFLGHVPGADYFKQLKRPHEIRYLDYLKFCNVHSEDMRKYDSHWRNVILRALQNSGCAILEQEYSRLDKEWKKDVSEREQFWRELRINEIEQDDARFNKELMDSVKRNAVDQLNMTYKDFTWKLDAEFGMHSAYVYR